ncbi:DotU family type IV/VI secretion system protein [Enterobacter asburiae]|uniref:DotU family type IV/VI secretion system protein n=1 Tax=Enterobacter asburiae TaxID=61645 RepID=UPI001FFF4BCD|nr:DotU family type IV/VI secretion system protein [Enterobacter asburiae]MCK2178015.1 DotU family type IV/VI secretion system protein [Enterobacter asburiae]
MELLNCYLPIFSLITSLELKSEQSDNYESFRKKCVTSLEQAVRDAENYDVTELERDFALFAVVVWLDEIVLCSTQSFANAWRLELLQRKYFNTSLGGELFFERLSKLDDSHIKVRRVFLFCLQNGYQGKYNSGLELSEIINTQRQLCLPVEWEAWPNNASITPFEVKRRSFTISTKRYVGLTALSIGVIYFALLMFMFLNFD